MRGKSWTIHILSDAWESTKWEILTDNPLHAVIAQTKLTEKFIEDEKGTDLILPRMLAEKPLEVECRKFYVWSANIEVHGHMGSCPGHALLTLQGKATKKPRKDELRERVGRIIERTLAGEARMETYKDRIAWRKRVRERRRAQVKRGTGDVPEEHRNQNDEQVAARHADASGVYIMENQHKEKIMRDIQVSKRGSGATSEEQSNKWRKTERAEHEAPNTSASSDPCVALEYPVSGEIQSRRGPYLCRNQVMFMTTCKFPRWMNSTRWMDERAVFSEKRWSGVEEKMPEISKESNWLRSGRVSTLSRRNFANLIRRS